MPGQKGVFGKIFEVTAAQRRALHVDAGAEDEVYLQSNCLLGQRLTYLVQQIHVPGGGQAGGGGKAGSGQTLLHQGVDVRQAANAVRAVGHEQWRDIEAGNGRCGPGAVTGAKGSFFSQAHLGDQGLNIGGHTLLLHLSNCLAHSSAICWLLTEHRQSVGAVVTASPHQAGAAGPAFVRFLQPGWLRWPQKEGWRPDHF